MLCVATGDESAYKTWNKWKQMIKNLILIWDEWNLSGRYVVGVLLFARRRIEHDVINCLYELQLDNTFDEHVLESFVLHVGGDPGARYLWTSVLAAVYAACATCAIQAAVPGRRVAICWCGIVEMKRLFFAIKIYSFNLDIIRQK